MRLRLVPTLTQWKNWSLPSKLTAIGTYIGIFSLLFAGYTYFFGSGTDELKRQAVLEGITRLSEDLEKIELLVPSNVSLSECLKEASSDDFIEKFESCVRSIKQKYEDADVLLKRDLANLSLLLDRDQFSVIVEISKRIRFFIYEMNNNQFIYERWVNSGCPNGIAIANGHDADLKSLHDRYPKCVLSVESYPSFLKNRKNGNLISAIKTDRMTIGRTMYFIFPGSEYSMREYFLGMNSQLYRALLTEIGLLRQNMATLMKAFG